MRICIDGVFFQFARSGIARVWSALLPLLASEKDVEIFLLDRGGVPDIKGVTKVPYPTYHHRYTPEDSLLLQKMCDHLKIDVFASTYYTTPMTTPSVLMIYDMIPELFDYDMAQRDWMEKAIAISFARRIVGTSKSTQTDLHRLYPHTIGRSRVSYPGYDEAVFRPLPRGDVARIGKTLGIDKPYFVLVGSREQHQGYKNAGLFFSAVAEIDDADFDVLCIGGEPELNPAHVANLPPNVRVRRIVATDQELAAAYGGALGLAYPSLYEGFGLPVLEAMACGCPVITSEKGSLAEVAGDACLLVDGYSVEEMKAAIASIQRPDVRGKLIKGGLARAKKFPWSTIVDGLLAAISEALEDAATPEYAAFARSWSQLRQLQADVDVEVMI